VSRARIGRTADVVQLWEFTMYAHLSMRLARYAARGRNTVRIRTLNLFGGFLAVIGLGACSSALAQSQAPHPADPHARIRTTPYRSVTTGYVSRRPVEPQQWRGRNDAVAPQEKK
jgi:hypothetical protein